MLIWRTEICIVKTFSKNLFLYTDVMIILLMVEFLHQLRLVVYPIIYRVLAPSQVVVWDFFHQQYLSQTFDFNFANVYIQGANVTDNSSNMGDRRYPTKREREHHLTKYQTVGHPVDGRNPKQPPRMLKPCKQWDKQPTSAV